MEFKHSRHIGLDDIECFVCAPAANNPRGLDLSFVQTEHGAKTVFTLPTCFQSYPGFLHGGIVSCVIDETMAYAGVFRYQKLPLTRKMTLSYRRGVEAGKEFICESQITAESETGFSAKASVSLPGRGIFVLGEADFILPTAEQAFRLMPGEAGEQWRKYFR
ncbi:hypothetical protein K2X33_01145 [bacterium]|nr:hypothetical protein [bacterium]